MTHETKTIELAWDGPFSWPGFERSSNLCPIPKIPGVYLLTFEYNSGYLIYAAGLTRRTVPTRFREHTDKYMNGEYNVLDVDTVQRGVRKEVWHGWSYWRKHREEFEERKSIIIAAVQKQLAGFRVFVTATIDMLKEERILERLEASIMDSLYQQPPPFCDIPDKGMMLAPRLKSEKPIIVKNKCAVKLHGIPIRLEI